MSKLTVLRNMESIEGLSVIVPKVFKDNRGYFTETYNYDEFVEEGFLNQFIQDNEVFSRKGVLRGFHVNINHPQAKLIRVISGEIFDIVIDLRNHSKTYKKWFSITLSGGNRKQLYIPENFGHAYLALEDSIIQFKVTSHYIAGDEVGFAWNSKEFNFPWPIKEIIQSEADSSSLDFAELHIE